jgi:autotransporter translocation and assembly factor TamB
LRRPIFFIYGLIKWLILLIIFLAFFSFSLLNSPAPFLDLLKIPLKEQGIHYDKIEGSLLTGFTLKNFDYKGQIKAKKLKVKIDFHQLEKRVLYIDNIEVDKLYIEKSFLTSLIESNSSEEKKEGNLTLPFDKVVVNNLQLGLHNIDYENYHLDSLNLKVNSFESDLKKSHKGKFDLRLRSNVVQTNLQGKIDNKLYRLVGDIEAEQSFINSFLKEQNLSVSKNPKIDISLNGDLKTLKYQLKVKQLALSQQPYHAKTEKLIVKGEYGLKSERLKVNLLGKIDSNVAKLDLKLKSSVKISDINNSLHFDVEGKVEPKKRFALKELQEQNITIKRLPKLTLMVKGSLQKSQFDFTLSQLEVEQNRIDLELKKLNLFGSMKALKGDLDLNFLTDFDSTIVSGKVEGKTALNVNKLSRDLRLDSKGKFQLHTAYVNKFLKESNVTLSGDTPIDVSLKGDNKKLQIELMASTHLETKGIASKVQLQTKKLALNLEQHQVEGELHLNSTASNLRLALKSDFSGNYMEPKKMRSNSRLNIMHFNAFGVNLNSLTPLALNVKSQNEAFSLLLHSKKLNIEAKSEDLDRVDFTLKSERIYPYKIVELPKELQKKFVKLNLRGDATLSKKYFTLNGAIEGNKEFKLNVDAKNAEEGLNALLSTKYLHLKAKGDIEQKNIVAELKIDSLKKLQKELNRLYTFAPVNVDGALALKATLQGEKVYAKLNSEILKFKGFNLEKVAIEGDYASERILLDKLSFNTTGFKKNSLNKRFYLNKRGVIALGDKKEILLDMHPKILIKGGGSKENLKITTQIEALPLGYPDYGEVELSCNIDYLQQNKKRKIIGGVFLDKLNVFFESKFLDPSSDNDVIVIKKNRKKKEVSDDFLENTAIDLGIYGKEAHYKTRDIKLSYIVNLKVNKKFKKPLRLLGKIEDIKGRVEQAPKLFTVVDSAIVFRGGETINPLLDLTVEHELPDVLITIGIHGSAKRPKLTFTSNPPLPKKDILSYLLLGVSTANLAEGKGSLGREAQLFIMNQAARDLAYEVDLDRVFIKDDGTGEGYAVQVGKKVNDKTMFVIENSKEGNSFILEYKINKDITVEVGQHQKTIPSQSIDLYYRKRFK